MADIKWIDSYKVMVHLLFTEIFPAFNCGAVHASRWRDIARWTWSRPLSNSSYGKMVFSSFLDLYSEEPCSYSRIALRTRSFKCPLNGHFPFTVMFNFSLMPKLPFSIFLPQTSSHRQSSHLEASFHLFSFFIYIFFFKKKLSFSPTCLCNGIFLETRPAVEPSSFPFTITTTVILCSVVIGYFSTPRATRWPVRAFGRSHWLIRGFQIWTRWLYLARWAPSRVLSELKNAPSYSFIHLISNYQNLSLKRSFRGLGEAILVGLCSLAVVLSKKLARAQEAF